MIQYYNIQKISDSMIEPISLTDIKNWMRVRDDNDNGLISDLITSARKHIEKLTSVALTNQTYQVLFELYGNRTMWVVDLPYTSFDCTPVVRMKNGINDYTTLVKNVDYEVIGGKIILYSIGVYDVQYECGYGQVPEDLVTDIQTLVTWSYENRGKRMLGDPKQASISEYPNWDGLNYHQHRKVVI